MASKKNAAAAIDDEEIIDLTDIIEQGAVSAPAAKKAPANEMSDLGNASDGEDVNLDMSSDIDALLSEMDGGAGAPPPGDSKASADHDINPDETLDMPGLSEVDSLLQELDMPPQPGSAAPTASALPADDDPSDLDALLDGMLESTAPATAEASAASTSPVAAPDLDGLDGLDELDSLLNAPASDEPEAAPASIAPDTAADMANMAAELDDLDALLSSDVAAVTAAAESDKDKPSGMADLGDLADLDALDDLLSGDAIEPPPATKLKATADPGPDEGADISLDDLDALLGDHSPAMPATEAKPAQVVDTTALDVDDLDALLGGRQPDESVVTTAKSIPDVSDLDGLDDLLDTVPTPDREPTPDTLEMLKNFDDTPLPATTVGDSVTSLTDDLMTLDALLDTEVPQEALGESLAEDNARSDMLPQTAAIETDVDMLEGLDSLLSGEQPQTDPLLDALLDGKDLDTVLSEAGMTDEAPALDSLNTLDAQDTAATLEAESWRAPLPDNAGEELPKDDDLADISAEDLQRAAQQLLDEKVMLEASTDDVDTGAWLESLDDALNEVAQGNDEVAPADAEVPHATAPIAEIPRAASVPAYAAAVAVSSALGEDERARMAELEERMIALEEQLQMRDSSHRQLLDRLNTLDLHHAEHLSALEARLGSVQAEAEAQTSARLSALESADPVGDALTEPSSQEPADAPSGNDLLPARVDLLEGRIMVLEDAEEKRTGDLPCAAVAAGSADVSSPDAPGTLNELADLDERLSALENSTAEAQLELEERLTTLELRFQQLDDDMRIRLEQAAAAAAAKLIREEIAALLGAE